VGLSKYGNKRNKGTFRISRLGGCRGIVRAKQNVPLLFFYTRFF
jgi:hypothetical protein